MASQNRGSLQPLGCWIRSSTKLKLHDRDMSILDSTMHVCVWCLAELPADTIMARQDRTLDHIFSRSDSAAYYGIDSPLAGKFLPDGRSINVADNLITACKGCNSKRADTNWQTFADSRPGSLDRILSILGDKVYTLSLAA